VKTLKTIGLLGFGEVGQRLADDLSALPDVSLCAWDVQFRTEGSGPVLAVRSRSRVAAVGSARELAGDCDLVISAVTAKEATAAAASVLGGVAPGTFVLDVNSVAPGTRRRTAETIESAGGRFVEAAVMSPIAPAGIASPMLLGGPHAAEFRQMAVPLGFSNSSVCSADWGVASATKMCRSIMVKGVEALFAESLLTARHYGVESSVIASLDNLFGSGDQAALARYMILRSVRHGERRNEEMREAAETVEEAGLEPWMSRASARRQGWVSQFKAALDCEDLDSVLDSIRSEMRC